MLEGSPDKCLGEIPRRFSDDEFLEETSEIISEETFEKKAISGGILVIPCSKRRRITEEIKYSTQNPKNA